MPERVFEYDRGYRLVRYLAARKRAGLPIEIPRLMEPDSCGLRAEIRDIALHLHPLDKHVPPYEYVNKTWDEILDG